MTRYILIVTLVSACAPAVIATPDAGAIETDVAPVTPDAGSDAGTIVVDAGTPDTGSDAGADAAVPATDAGRDAGVPVTSDAGRDAAVVTASITAVTDEHCALDSAGVWRCWTGATVTGYGPGWVQVGGRCARRADASAACATPTGLVEVGDVPGDIVAHATANSGCATDGTAHVCWDGGGTIRTCTRGELAVGPGQRMLDIILASGEAAVCAGANIWPVLEQTSRVVVAAGWAPSVTWDPCLLGWTAATFPRPAFSIGTCARLGGIRNPTTDFADTGTDFAIAVDTLCGRVAGNLLCTTQSSGSTTFDLGPATAYAIGYDPALATATYASAAELCVAVGNSVTCYALGTDGTTTVRSRTSW